MKSLLPILLMLSAPAFAGESQQEAPPPPAPCSAPEYRQLDFWVGQWQFEYDLPDGGTGTARNAISREYGPCVIVERFSMPDGYRGSSYSMYDQHARQWRQMWVDNRGGTFTLVGGPVEDQAHSFELRTLEPPGKDGRMRRMIWEDVSADALVWRWQSQQADGRWKDEWVLRYRRAGADAAGRGEP